MERGPDPWCQSKSSSIKSPTFETIAKVYRGLAALGNFVAQDRADIGFAAKEVSKTMADPAECDLLAVKRLGRYLTQYPRHSSQDHC